MGLSSFLRLTRHATSDEAMKRYWLFYAGPENYLFEGGVRDLPQEAFWSCEPETKRGDLVLVYRKSMNHLSVDHLVREFGVLEDVAKRVKNTGIDAGLTVSELAQKHRRTEGAIQSRLEKLGKVPSRFRSGLSP